MKTIKLWHGGRFKNEAGSRFEIGRGKKDRCEHGPGIYASTDIGTASKYAKGGGRITLIELDANVGWMDNSVVKFADVVEFVRETPKLRNRKPLMDDVLRAIRRSGRDDGTIYASVLCNLCYFHNALVGESAQLVAKFYKDRGIHASLVAHGNEDWVVIHDVSKIVSAKNMTSDNAYAEKINNLGKVEEQLKIVAIHNHNDVKTGNKPKTALKATAG